MHVREMFEEKLENYSNNLKKLNTTAERYSTIRLITFLAGLALVIFMFYKVGKMEGFLVLALWLGTFIFLVIKHQKIIDEAKRASNLVEINKKYIARIKGDWTYLTNEGSEFLNSDHEYAKDLDIFGHASLYSFINTANTFYGRLKLKNLLVAPDKNKEEILKRQNAVKELAGKIDFCQSIECEGMVNNDICGDPVNLLQYSENGRKLFSKGWIEYIFYILPLLTIVSIIICILDRSVSILIPFVLLMIQAGINLIGLPKTGVVLKSLNSYKEKVKVYQKMLKLIEDQKFENEYLNELKSMLSREGKGASQQIMDLEKIVDAFDAMSNDLLAIISNLLLFWNFHCVFALENWKSKSGMSIRSWIETIGMFEALGSIAVISQTNPHWVMPVFSDKKVFLNAQNMGHPLIRGDKRVNNNIKLDDSICIITGSNMSGKTTLLRTIGINLVIAYAGGAVCGDRFETSIMEIYTSMRITDDLSEGISTFYAELLRIKMIVEAAKKKVPMIFLIDEMFRGTNSMDRICGAKNVLLNLSREWIIGLISTHDFELCALEKDGNGKIENYHFSESYKNNKIEFDYKLKNGRCTTTNAKYLMKMVGIDIKEESV